MFGLGLMSKTKKVLKDYFNYQPNNMQKYILAQIVNEAKRQDLNEYDASMMFMLVQMNSLMGEGEDVKTFIRIQSKNVESVMSLAISPYSDIIEMLKEVKSSHGVEH